MKKITLFLFGCFIAFSLSAQVFVDTDITKKNALIEEFTAKGCGWCPRGHQISNETEAAYQDKIFSINIHNGGLANGTPNYKTDFGDELTKIYPISGYPAGIVNRRKFNGYTDTDYTSFKEKFGVVVVENALVNVAAEASIDVEKRLFKVVVEVYYTGEMNSHSNLLNVALLQNNIIGPQTNYGIDYPALSGGKPFNEEYVISQTNGTEYIYKHMHMLRHLLTGQWGDTIKSQTYPAFISSGQFFTKTYEYQLPRAVNEVPLLLEDLEIVVFLTNLDHKTVHNANGCTPELKISDDFADITNVALKGTPGCNNLATPTVTIKNMGNNPLTSAKFKYGDYGYDYEWVAEEGENIETFDSKEITLTPTPIEMNKKISVNVSLTSVNNIDITSVPNFGTIQKDENTIAENGVKLILKLDRYGSHITWNVSNSSGTKIQEGGDYPDLGQAGTQEHNIDLEITEDGCYTFEINDSKGDGINSAANGAGGYRLVDGKGSILVLASGRFGFGEKREIQYNVGISGIKGVNGNINSIMIYPNPVKNMATLAINLKENTFSNITVVDLTGRTVMNLGNRNLNEGDNNIEINTSTLNNGMYLVKVVTNNATITKKISVSK